MLEKYASNGKHTRFKAVGFSLAYLSRLYVDLQYARNWVRQMREIESARDPAFGHKKVVLWELKAVNFQFVNSKAEMLSW